MPFTHLALRRIPALLAVVPFSLVAESGALETMVVTASRTPVPAYHVGSSYTTIDETELSRRQAVSLAEVLRDVPGFSVSRSGVLGAATQIRVRGAEASQLLVLIDGVEANDLSQGSEFNFAHLLTTDIERVEIIRGPQSALWGSDALAGVINIITKRGEGTPAASGYVEAGAFSTLHGGGGVSGGGDAYHFNAAAAVIDSGGSNISRTGDEDDGYKNVTLSFSGGIELFDNLSFSAAARHVEARNQFDAIDFFVTGLPADADDESEVDQDYARAEAKWRLLNGRWEHTLAGTFTGTENDNFSGDREIDSTQGRKYGVRYQSSLYFDARRPVAGDHTLTFALDYDKEEFTQRGTATFFGDPNQDLDMDSLGIIGEYRIELGEAASFSFGARHEDNSDFSDDTTWRLTGAYTYAATDTRLHAAYGTGSKNPSFTERFGFFGSSITPFIGNPGLEPERSRGWEIGADQPLHNDRLRLGVTYFHETLRNEINGFVFDPVTFAFTAENVDGKSRRQGVEVTAAVSPASGLQLNGTYTYLDATEPDASGVQVREVRRPRHGGSINLNYEFAGNRANLNLNVHYNGEQEDIFFPPFPEPPRIVTLDDFILVSLTGEYRLWRNLVLFGRIENLLDEDYEEVLGFQALGFGAFAGVKIRLPQ